jgi:hypothetical protein
LYVASSEEDAKQCDRETDNVIVLDRSKKWNSNKAVTGSRTKYDFRNVPTEKQIGALKGKNLMVSQYPCRCVDCSSQFYTTKHSVTGKRMELCLQRTLPVVSLEDEDEDEDDDDDES